MKRVVVVGSAIIDVLVKSNDFRVMKSQQISGGVALCEVYGGKTEADEMLLEVGGAGTNVAVGLARLGLYPAAVTRVSNDWMGEKILGELRLNGVESTMVQKGEGSGGMSVILVAPDGGRSIITYRGISAKIEGAKINWNQVEKADWLHISSLGGEIGLMEDLIHFAHSKGIGVSLNPGRLELSRSQNLHRLAQKISILILNKSEAMLWLGVKSATIRDLAQKISSQGVKTVAITDGKNGAGIFYRQTWYTARAYRTKSVDDTGAGDAFVAGVISGIVGGQKIETTLKMGMANGANTVNYLGAKRGLLDKKEMKSWLRRRLTIVEEKV